LTALPEVALILAGKGECWRWSLLVVVVSVEEDTGCGGRGYLRWWRGYWMWR